MARWSLLFAFIVLGDLLLPHPRYMPVKGAGRHSHHPDSFWHHPWGRSGTHKGVDLFAPMGTPVIAATGGLVLFAGHLERGGHVALVLGPKWRLHYYAHLQAVHVHRFRTVRAGSILGTVGDTGNARGKPPHLHYSILTLVPHPWRIDGEPQGWKKMFYLDPTRYFPKG